jgi:uncharacterized membrane protein YccF (DUF307 family)
MSLILNILWLILGGGLVMGLLWLIVAGIMAISIIGLPFARAAVSIASYSAWPYGRDLVARRHLEGDVSASKDDGLSILGNVIWFVLGGVWLAISHVVAAIPLAISIIGLPFAYAHLKLASASFAPIGRRVVSKAMAEEVNRRAAATKLDQSNRVTS